MTAQDLGKQVYSVLLTLIMTHLSYQQFIFVSEIIVIVHLSSQEGICSTLNGSLQEKSSCPTTQCHTTNLATV